MNEAIMLVMLYSEHCVVTQESQSSSSQAPRSSFSYTRTAGLVDFGRTGVVAQRGRSASFRSGKSLPSSSPERGQTEIANPSLPETQTQISQNKPFTEDTTVLL